MRYTIPALETLRLDRPRGGVAVLSLARPDRLNAMTDRMFGELETVALALDQENALRVLILTGDGRAFCAGYDLADAEQLTSLGAMGMLDLQERAAGGPGAGPWVPAPGVA